MLAAAWRAPSCAIAGNAMSAPFDGALSRRHLAQFVSATDTSMNSLSALMPIALSSESRDALLAAIANARGWIDAIRLGCIGSFAEIAEREIQGERHIRLLAPLAFLSPRMIAAIVNGTAPADLTVTGLAKARHFCSQYYYSFSIPLIAVPKISASSRLL
ncbi:MAG: hypothetical protein ACREC0_04930 [Methylocella sp.]